MRQNGGPQRGQGPALLLLPLLLLAAAAARAAAQAAGDAATIPIDWAAVPDTLPAAKDLQANCICDVLPATCTPNCCCDPGCPAAAVAAARAAGTCLPEGAPPQQLEYCAPSDAFARVRVRQRSWGPSVIRR